MTAKEYLQQIYNAHRRVIILRETIEEIKAEMYSVKSPQLKAINVQSSVSNDSMDRLIAKAEEMTGNMTKEVSALIELQSTISGQIERMPNKRRTDQQQKEILHRRYVLFQRWERIAADMDVSTRYVFKVHGTALKTFQRLYLVH